MPAVVRRAGADVMPQRMAGRGDANRPDSPTPSEAVATTALSEAESSKDLLDHGPGCGHLLFVTTVRDLPAAGY
ncbi:MAG TPA: hypothetical protein VGL21_01855, partial [Jatrophihabitantaceae bacterium]